MRGLSDGTGLRCQPQLRFAVGRREAQQEYVLTRALAWRAGGIRAKRLLPVRGEQRPPSVARDVRPRQVPEGDLCRRAVVSDVASMMREPIHLRALSASVRLHRQDLVVPGPPLDLIRWVA